MNNRPPKPAKTTGQQNGIELHIYPVTATAIPRTWNIKVKF